MLILVQVGSQDRDARNLVALFILKPTNMALTENSPRVKRCRGFFE